MHAFIDKFMTCTRKIKHSPELSAHCKEEQDLEQDAARDQLLRDLDDKYARTGVWNPSVEDAESILSNNIVYAQLKENATRWLGNQFTLKRALKTRAAIKKTLEWDGKHELIPSEQDWRTLESLVKLLDPFLDAVTLLQGEQYPTMCQVSPFIALLIEGLAGNEPLESWGFNTAADKNNAGDVIPWSQRSPIIFKARNLLLHGLQTRFDLGDLTAGIASVCAPLYKKLEFVPNAQQRSAIFEQFKEEVKIVYEAERQRQGPAGAAAAAGGAGAASAAAAARPAASRHGSGGLPGLSLPGSARSPAVAAAASAQRSINDEIDQYLALEELDVATLDWWKENCARFPHVAILARKYLAIPCSSAPAERVFSQAKVLYARSRWRMAPETLSHLVFLRCNKKFDKTFSS